LHTLKGKILSNFRRLTNASKKTNTEYKVTLENNPELPLSQDVEKIEISDYKLVHIKTHIYNFLYQNQERIDNIAVFNFLNSPNTYFIKGAKNSQKISVN